jgi:hypothetical protein
MTATGEGGPVQVHPLPTYRQSATPMDRHQQAMSIKDNAIISCKGIGADTLTPDQRYLFGTSVQTYCSHVHSVTITALATDNVAVTARTCRSKALKRLVSSYPWR